MSAFSPPDSSELEKVGLPGGVATISTPASSGSSDSSRIRSACPPPNDLRYRLLEVDADRFERVHEQSATVGVDPLDDPLQRVFGGGEILVLAVQFVVALLQSSSSSSASMLTDPVRCSWSRSLAISASAASRSSGGSVIFGRLLGVQIDFVIFRTSGRRAFRVSSASSRGGWKVAWTRLRSFVGRG